MASTRSGYLAVIKEATPGTAIQPTHFIHYKDGDLGANLEVIISKPIQATRWGAITATAGKKDTSGAFNMELDWLEAGYWFGSALKFPTSITNNGDGTFTHQFDTDDEIEALTVEQGKGDITGSAFEINRAFGAYVDTLELSASDSLVMMNITLKSIGIFQRARMLTDSGAGASVIVSLEDVEGLTTADSVIITDDSNTETDPISALSATNNTVTIATLDNSYTVAAGGRVELAPLTPSYSVQKLFSFDMVSFRFGDTVAAATSATAENVEDWTFTYGNNIEERYGSLRKTPSVVAPKSASSQLKFKRYFENRTDRDRYLNTTRKAVVINIKDENTIIGSGSRNPEIIVEISDLRYTAYELPTGEDELYVAEVEGECFFDATDAKATSIKLVTTIADFAA